MPTDTTQPVVLSAERVAEIEAHRKLAQNAFHGHPRCVEALDDLLMIDIPALIASHRALELRLEIVPGIPYDGIAARDETIRQLEEQVRRLTEAGNGSLLVMRRMQAALAKHAADTLWADMITTVHDDLEGGIAELAAALQPAETQTPQPLVFGYTNYRGEFGVRRAIPQRVYFGATDWHSEPQWLLEAHDLDKDAVRVFAMKDMAPAETPTLERELAEAELRLVNTALTLTWEHFGVLAAGQEERLTDLCAASLSLCLKRTRLLSTEGSSNER